MSDATQSPGSILQNLFDTLGQWRKKDDVWNDRKQDASTRLKAIHEMMKAISDNHLVRSLHSSGLDPVSPKQAMFRGAGLTALHLKHLTEFIGNFANQFDPLIRELHRQGGRDENRPLIGNSDFPDSSLTQLGTASQHWTGHIVGKVVSLRPDHPARIAAEKEGLTELVFGTFKDFVLDVQDVIEMSKNYRAFVKEQKETEERRKRDEEMREERLRKESLGYRIQELERQIAELLKEKGG